MILREALLEQLALYRGWVYGSPRYPSALPGVRLPLAPPNHVDCCSFVEGLVIGAAVRAGLDPGWGLAEHNRAMVLTPRDRFGPVEVLIDAGLAWPLALDDVPPAWTVCQGWRRDGGGHTFLIAETAGQRVLLLEANRGYMLNGPGWRAIAPLGEAREDQDGLPPKWWQDPLAWTWAMVRDLYPELAVCALRVGDDRAVLPERWPEPKGSIRA